MKSTIKILAAGCVAVAGLYGTAAKADPVDLAYTNGTATASSTANGNIATNANDYNTTQTFYQSQAQVQPELRITFDQVYNFSEIILFGAPGYSLDGLYVAVDNSQTGAESYTQVSNTNMNVDLPTSGDPSISFTAPTIGDVIRLQFGGTAPTTLALAEVVAYGTPAINSAPINASVPEPGTMALLLSGLGFAGMGLGLRRRRPASVA